MSDKAIIPTPDDKIVSVIVESTDFEGNWSIPVLSHTKYSGKFEDLKKHFRINEVTARRLISTYNKDKKFSNQRQLEARKQGYQAGTIFKMKSYKKGILPQREPDKVYQEGNIHIERYQGKNPF